MIPAAGGHQAAPTAEQLEEAGMLEPDEEDVVIESSAPPAAPTLNGSCILVTPGRVEVPGVLETPATVTLAWLRSQRETVKYSIVKVLPCLFSS